MTGTKETGIEIRGLVVFSILMENNQGILAKAPSYLLEKYELVILSGENPERLLDEENLKKFEGYMERWRDYM